MGGHTGRGVVAWWWCKGKVGVVGERAAGRVALAGDVDTERGKGERLALRRPRLQVRMASDAGSNERLMAMKTAHQERRRAGEEGKEVPLEIGKGASRALLRLSLDLWPQRCAVERAESRVRVAEKRGVGCGHMLRNEIAQ